MEEQNAHPSFLVIGFQNLRNGECGYAVGHKVPGGVKD